MLASRYSAAAPKVEPIRHPTLFEMDKLEQAGNLVNNLNVERPYFEPGLWLGTSAFTANGWQGSFYPPGMQTRDYLSYYATQFKTVEIDSTYYATPSASTVSNWYQRTPPDFVFAAKVPQVVSHQKALKDSQAECGVIKAFRAALSESLPTYAPGNVDDAAVGTLRTVRSRVDDQID